MKTPQLDTSLWQPHSWLSQGWTQGTGGNLEVFNPANQQRLTDLSYLSPEQLEQAIHAAEQQRRPWAQLGGFKRAELLRIWADLILQHRQQLACILMLEQGKPLAEAEAEIRYAAALVFWFAEEARRIEGFIPTSSHANQDLLVFREPIGVCGLITPWNFPAAMITRKAAAALAAGCPVLVKPSELTPLTALALAQLSENAGFPRGVLQVVLGPAEQVGRSFCHNPLIRKLSFTGSTRVGQLLVAQSAQNLPRLSLELGGHAPFIVCADADIEAATQGILFAKLRNSGQACIAANRVLVHQSKLDELSQALARAFQQLRVGAGWLPQVQVGPLINEAALVKQEQQIQDAVAQGAEIQAGGHRLAGQFFKPTLLTGVTESMQVFRDESFGPILPISSFDTDEHALQLANASPYGLAAYCYTRDLKRAFYFGHHLEYGMVGLNTATLSAETTPFGGIKQSGYGREGSKLGIDEYLSYKYLCVG